MSQVDTAAGGVTGGRVRAARLWPIPQGVKVPAITLGFWVLKVLTTGTGEAASDYLVDRNAVVSVLLGAVALVACLVLQLRTRVHRAVPYWLAVSAVAVFGTMAADVVHIVLGLGYTVTSVGYTLGVIGVFGVWFLVERTLDVHSITTRRRELFYWVAVLATFALGTAVGDFSAITADLGFLPSAVLYAVLIAVPAVAWRAGASPVLTFWAAYVLTRPLGASIADWAGKPAGSTGLGLGDGPVALVGAALIVALVLREVRRESVRPA